MARAAFTLPRLSLRILCTLAVAGFAASHFHTCSGMDFAAVFVQGVSWPTGTSIAFPGSEEYSSATERWTIHAPPSYALAISPSSEDAVAQAVKLAVANNVPFLATGGRHGYSTTFGKLHNGLAIDLSKLDTIDVDVKAATLTIGPGTKIGDIIGPLYKEGLEIQTGSCSCVSMIGVTLGAGVGRQQGLHGLIIDALVSVRLVTATGDIIDVSCKSNPDLFWGIRGAGANFGIVVSATYTVHKLTNGGQILNADMIFTGDKVTAYFQALKAYGTLPAELVPVQGFFWDANSNSTVLIANWQYWGPEEEGRKQLAPILDLKPIVQNISVVPSNKLLQVQAFGADAALSKPGKNLISYSVNVKQDSVPSFERTYDAFAKFFAEHPGGRNSSALFETFPNTAVKAVPIDSTSYPWRDAVGNYLFQFIFDKDDTETAAAAKALGQQVRADFSATSGYGRLAVYNSYAGGDESVEEIFGVRFLPRLAALKKQWDPSNVFKYQNALPTQYP
ncbi:Glucooligosaccharide oxidase [Xylariaceae sp. FL1272]|nr:Glucooligosaccharide oxidase [Xylariaceae sp. FL1272]